MKKFCVIILFIYPVTVISQGLHSLISGGGAYSKNFVDIFCPLNNQACLSEIKKPAVGFYSERRFMLKELTSFSAVAILPKVVGSFGLIVHYSGNKYMNQTELGLAYGKKLGDVVSAGIQFNYYLLRINGYGNGSSITGEIGFLFHLTDKLVVGFHIYNPDRSKLSGSDLERLPFEYKTGMGYELSGQCLITTELVKAEMQALDVRVGIHYAFTKELFVRAGIHSGYNNYWLAIGFRFKKYTISFSASYHPQLGYSPGLYSSFDLGQKMDKE